MRPERPGLWSGLVLMLAVMQLPPLIVLGPVAAYVFTARSTSVAVAFLVWSLIVSASAVRRLIVSWNTGRLKAYVSSTEVTADQISATATNV